MRFPLVLGTALATACGAGTIDNTPGDGDGDGDRYHPVGYSSSAMHGPEFNLQAQDCRACHNQDLTGANDATSCDDCHTPSEPQAWRSDCTFCHGGVQDTTGAPPGELDGSDLDTAFGAHRAHLGSSMMTTLDCSDCHNTPDDALTEGHAFDDTPGAAEVVFAAGRSPDGTYANAQCDNLYCHGDGRQNALVMSNVGTLTCSGCHGEPPNSGEHNEHRGDNCLECHNDTTKDDVSIADPALHLDGLRQVVIDNPGGLTVTVNGNQVVCSGQCHGVGRNHGNDSW